MLGRTIKKAMSRLRYHPPGEAPRVPGSPDRKKSELPAKVDLETDRTIHMKLKKKGAKK